MSVRLPARAVARTVLLAATLAPLAGCEWFTDFKRQPSIATWEAPDSAGTRGSPQGSVPITGMAVPAFAVSYAPLPPTIDSMAGLANPIRPDSASLANGRMQYTINCAVCHGLTGRGDGPATKYGIFPFPLVGGIPRSDGYIFGMIRNGRGMMPSYNRIEERERWDIVNYIRGLQGALGAAVPTGPVGVPGFTGAALPGPSPLAPTRPAPHTPADMAAFGARGDTAARDTTTGTANDTTRSGARTAPRGGDRQ